MKNRLLTLLSAFMIATGSAAFAETCFADYKAKQNNPLRLHYGVVEIKGSCTKAAAQTQLTSRLKEDGWVLLNVLSVFDSSGLAQRKGDAGKFYLRY